MSELRRVIATLPLAARLTAEIRSTPADAGARHDRAVRALVARASTTPFYRRRWERHVDPEHEPSAAALLAALPVVDHLAWRTAAAEEVELVGVGESVIRLATGGSSGRPLQMPYRAVDYRRLRAGILATMRSHGARLTRRMLRFLPPDVDMQGGRELFGWVRHVASGAPTEERATALARGSWGMLRSYPWPAWRAAVQLLRSGTPVRPVPLVFGGGEVLTATVRRTLERALGGRVVDRYAATDWGLIACECRQGRMHVMPGFAHVEILADESPALPGVVGDVVVTSLTSSARPIVRVRSGDLAAFSTTGCGCGNRAPCLEFVAGHRDEAICLPTGQRIVWPAIEAAFPPREAGVLGWQVEQTGARDVVVRVALTDRRALPPALAPRLCERLPAMRVELTPESDFRRERNGKTKAVVGLLPH